MPRATKDKLSRPDANDPRVLRDEARALGLYATARARGWQETGAKDARGVWRPAKYDKDRLVPIPTKAAAARRAAREQFVLFEPDPTGELPEVHVFCAAWALEYVSLLDSGGGITSAFKALARVRHRLREAPSIGLERAVGKAVGELVRIEREAKHTHQRLSEEDEHVRKRIMTITSAQVSSSPTAAERKAFVAHPDWERLWHVVRELGPWRSDVEEGCPDALPLLVDRERVQRQLSQPEAELWLVGKIRAELAQSDLRTAVETIESWFVVHGSSRRTSPVVLLDALLNEKTSPLEAEGWSRSSAARLWHRAHHAPSPTRERQLAVALYTAQSQGKPLSVGPNPQWWSRDSVLF